ncbi:cell division protein ZapA [bacterium]|nr:cell division protein ZapA [bacterium]MDA9901212.1 cell division protein ZapA [Gammaproteobacteria bacterium]MDB2444169.1 cell division protein ZapA [Gammaproteobacteria bacterium]MDG0998816.1 cell division protein ZapA [Gammaproteobacteria bacterium]MDG1951670.1 cell division protein ZapA [Gammaproteobacteria bacterium]|tara:strand:+ start:14546 stop:14860 length:315 start_codon:yes stop_codon:yes gene_type:complete
MLNDAKSIQVKILDKEYNINCPPEEQEALLKSANYLDKNMRSIRDLGKITGTEKIAIMAALNITNDMLRKNVMINESRQLTTLRLQELEKKIDPLISANKQLEL